MQMRTSRYPLSSILYPLSSTAHPCTRLSLVGVRRFLRVGRGLVGLPDPTPAWGRPAVAAPIPHDLHNQPDQQREEYEADQAADQQKGQEEKPEWPAPALLPEALLDLPLVLKARRSLRC